MTNEELDAVEEMEAKIARLNRINGELAQHVARMLESNGKFRSDLVYAIAGTREQLLDEQIIATAKQLADECRNLKRIGVALMFFVLEDYYPDCATRPFREAVEAAKVAFGITDEMAEHMRGEPHP